MDKHYLMEKFADVIIKFGINLQEDQVLNIITPVECYDFARVLAIKAYKAKAKKVIIDYTDYQVDKQFYLSSTESNLSNIEEYEIEKAKYLVENNLCTVEISSPIPNVMDTVDPKKINIYKKSKSEKLGFLEDYSLDNIGQWCVVAYPNEAWAKEVFKDDLNAYNKLFSSIMKSSRITLDNDPVNEWINRSNELEEIMKKLNNYNFKTLKFKNNLGTDLTMDLVDNHIWGGGKEITQSGISFFPNLPTEEVFTMPHSNKVNGRVYATRPLNYQGKIIEDFYLDFKDGAVINYFAKTNQDALASLLSLDEGSMRLGEVALINYDSVISKSNILFYNSLLDENASCHLALGNAYTMNIKDGYNKSSEELKKIGCNKSMVHADFMFGSKDLSVVGITHDNKVITIFKKGNFVF